MKSTNETQSVIKMLRKLQRQVFQINYLSLCHCKPHVRRKINHFLYFCTEKHLFADN